MDEDISLSEDEASTTQEVMPSAALGQSTIMDDEEVNHKFEAGCGCDKSCWLRFQYRTQFSSCNYLAISSCNYIQIALKSMWYTNCGIRTLNGY